MIEKYLDLAVADAKVGVENEEGGPFGAVIVNSSFEVVGRGHNKVLSTHDPTNHAEIVAIREACQKLGTHDLSGCTIYSSCEPCPMCLSAIIWSNIKTLYYGATRVDAARIGFRDDAIYDYLADKNYILVKEQVDNLECKQLLESYEGEIY